MLSIRHRRLSQVEPVAERGPSQGVGDCDDVALDVVGGRVTIRSVSACPLRATAVDGPAERVDLDAGRGVAVAAYPADSPGWVRPALSLAS